MKSGSITKNEGAVGITFCCPALISQIKELEGWARKPVYHTSLVAVVSRTDRPKSIHNLCVIELFGDVFFFLLSLCPFDISFRMGTST